MNNKQIIILFVAISNLLSCTNHKSREPEKNISKNYSVNLVTSSSMKFNLDEVSTFSPYTLQYLDDGEEYLLTTNENTLSIDVYSFTEKKKIYSIGVNDNNTAYVNNIGGFWAKSKDSIFVYTRYRMSPILLTLENWEVVKKEVIPIMTPEGESPFFNHASNTAAPSFVLGNQIYFKELPMTDVTKLIGTGYSPEVVYDLNKATSYRSGVTWPAAYDDTWLNMHFYYRTFDDKDRVLYSWQASHDLMVKDADSIFQVSAKSDTFEDKIKYNPNDFDAHGVDFNETLLDHYIQILYDKYRKVYYRFAQHGMEKHKVDGTPNGYLDAVHSIIILDENFKKIGETYLEQNNFLPKDIFVGKEGLYISDHNTKNYKTLGEDVMSFSLFKLISQ